MSIVAQILSQMSGLSGPQRKMLAHLLSLWPCVRGRFNFLNLSRYSSCCERTLRRHFAASFDWGAFNAQLLQASVPAEHELMLAQDASFVPKSGRHTPGLGWFYNGLAGRTEKGLELSLVSVVDLTHNTAYALHAQQSPPPKAEAKSVCKDVEHLHQTQPHWPAGVRHLAVDGAYTRRAFVDGVCQLGLEMVGKLRRDAHLRYLFQGPQKPRGRRRLYEDKVLWKTFDPQVDSRRWNHEGPVEPGVHLYSACLFHPSLKRVIKVALLRKEASASASPSQVLLFSTDLSRSGRQIVRMYRARFQIEFLFRDAKGGAGLTHCQSRQGAALHCHWNMAFAALNLAKAKPAHQPAHQPPGVSRPRFSWRSVQQQNANQHFLQLFSSKLGLDWNLIQTHPNFQQLCNYGVIAP